MLLFALPSSRVGTAVEGHTLGTSNPIQVTRGDKINVNISNATQADLAAGALDVFPVFGGNTHTAPHPTHACPAYEVATDHARYHQRSDGADMINFTVAGSFVVAVPS